jgi:hypothetical protein
MTKVTKDLENAVTEAVAILERKEDREKIENICNGIGTVLGLASVLDPTRLGGETCDIIKAVITALKTAYNKYEDYQKQQTLKVKDALAALGPFDIAKAGMVKTKDAAGMAMDGIAPVLGAIPGVGNITDAVLLIIKPAVMAWIEAPIKVAETRAAAYKAELAKLNPAAPLPKAEADALHAKVEAMRVEAAKQAVTDWTAWRGGIQKIWDDKGSALLDAGANCLSGADWKATVEYYIGQITGKITEKLLEIIPPEPAQEVHSADIGKALEGLKTAYTESLRTQVAQSELEKIDKFFHYAQAGAH